MAFKKPNQQPAKKLPDFIAYTVSDHDPDDKGFWTQIGAAWQHEDGDGFNLKLVTIPLDGQIVLRVRKDNAKKDKA